MSEEKAPRKSKGSRRRAIAAFCYECRGGSSRHPCTSPACALYAFLPEAKQASGPARRWWEDDVHTWNEGSQRARGVAAGQVLAGEDPDQMDLLSGPSDEEDEDDDGKENGEE